LRQEDVYDRIDLLVYEDIDAAAEHPERKHQSERTKSDQRIAALSPEPQAGDDVYETAEQYK